MSNTSIKSRDIIFSAQGLGALCVGVGLWIVYLYPVWQLGIFSKPLDWPTINHLEGVTLTTFGKWFFEYPYRMWNDGFSGDFPVYYQYVSDLLLNLLAKIFTLPPMVIQAIYLGPLYGLFYVLINYFFLAKVFGNLTIALLGATLNAFMWHSRITDFAFPEYVEATKILHVPFITLMLATSQSLGWICFIPAICLMYLAYTREGLRYKVLYGVLLGILLQASTLTFINILVINCLYVSLNAGFNLYNSSTLRIKRFVAFFYLATLSGACVFLAYRYNSGQILLLQPNYILLAGILLFAGSFLCDKNKAFYLVAYPCSLLVALPYLVNMKQMANAPAPQTLECTACVSFGLQQLLIYYFPNIVAAIIGLWFILFGRFKDTKLAIWMVSCLYATFLLSYNEFIGWGNHPYRFAINLLIPLMVAASLGLYYGFRSRMAWKVGCLILSVWFSLATYRNVNDVFHDRRHYDNPTSLTSDQYSLLSSLKKETKSGDYILTSPTYDVAILLNYSKARSFLPDYRFLLSKEIPYNRLNLFRFLFPSYGGEDSWLISHDKHTKTQFAMEEDQTFVVKKEEIKFNVLKLFGVTHLVSMDPSFCALLKETAAKWQWETVISNAAGILVKPTAIALPGIARFEKGKFTQLGFTASFMVDEDADYFLAAAGTSISRYFQNLIIDGKTIPLTYLGKTIVLQKITLSKGEHQITFPSESRQAYTCFFFFNILREDVFDQYLSIPQ